MAAKESELMFNQRIAAQIMAYWMGRGCNINVVVEAITGLSYTQRDGAAYAVRSDLVNGLPRSGR